MEEWLRSWTWESHIQTQVQILVLPLTLVSLNYFISHWAGLLHLYSLYLNTTYLHGVLLKNLRWWIQSTKHSFRYKSSMQWEPLCYDYLFQKEEINDYESTLVLYSILHLSTTCEEKLMAGISIYQIVEMYTQELLFLLAPSSPLEIFICLWYTEQRDILG